MNKKLIITVAAAVLLSAAGAGAAAWWLLPKPQAVGHEAKKVEAEAEKKPLKYITLDKVIVMLRRGPNEAESHYMSADLVLATPVDKEKHAKEHLPLLRSIAVAALSSYTMTAASQMTVEQFADHLNKTFNASYAKERLEKPFSEVMIGKLIIE
jgi:flagellar FliL protein